MRRREPDGRIGQQERETRGKDSLETSVLGVLSPGTVRRDGVKRTYGRFGLGKLAAARPGRLADDTDVSHSTGNVSGF